MSYFPTATNQQKNNDRSNETNTYLLTFDPHTRSDAYQIRQVWIRSRFQMALSLSSIPSISVARWSNKPSTATILNSYISIPSFKSPRRVSFISRHQCAVVDQVFVPQTAVFDRNSVSLAEFKTEAELWAAVCLRIRTFYEFNQSSVGVEVW